MRCVIIVTLLRMILFPRDAMHKRGICRHAVSVRPCVCPSVTFVHSVKMNKDIFEFFSPSGSHTILVFPYQTSWHYSDGNPPPANGGVEGRYDGQKSRFWANIWLHRVLWTRSAIHSAATDHGELMTLFVRRRRSVWQEASTLRRTQQSST